MQGIYLRGVGIFSDLTLVEGLAVMEPECEKWNNRDQEGRSYE